MACDPVSSEFASGAIPALLGAVVGGAFTGWVSYWLQKREHDKQDELRKQDRLEEQRALAAALQVKLIGIHTSTNSLREYLNNVKERIEATPAMREPWGSFEPLVTMPQPEKFRTNELTFILGLKDQDLFREIATIDSAFIGTLNLFHTMNDLKFQIMRNLKPVPIEGSSEVGIPSESITANRILLDQFNSVFEQSFQWVIAEQQRIDNLIKKYQTVANEYLDISAVPKKTVNV